MVHSMARQNKYLHTTMKNYITITRQFIALKNINHCSVKILWSLIIGRQFISITRLSFLHEISFFYMIRQEKTFKTHPITANATYNLNLQLND